MQLPVQVSIFFAFCVRLYLLLLFALCCTLAIHFIRLGTLAFVHWFCSKPIVIRQHNQTRSVHSFDYQGLSPTNPRVTRYANVTPHCSIPTFRQKSHICSQFVTKVDPNFPVKSENQLPQFTQRARAPFGVGEQQRAIYPSRGCFSFQCLLLML